MTSPIRNTARFARHYIQLICLSPFAAICLVILSLNSSRSFANDGAAAFGAGGIVFVKETRVELLREDLSISKDMINVTYQFKNNSSQDVTTEVAFPIPTFRWSDSPLFGYFPKFDNFEVEVDGKNVQYNTEVRAWVEGKDYAHVLNAMGIDIAHFGSMGITGEEEIRNSEGTVTGRRALGQFKSLSPTQLKELLGYGLIRVGYNTYPYEPNWAVTQIFHWQQVFPPGMIVRIRHSYSPYAGNYTSVVSHKRLELCRFVLRARGNVQPG
jgi:hypothetical protein